VLDGALTPINVITHVVIANITSGKLHRQQARINSQNIL